MSSGTNYKKHITTCDKTAPTKNSERFQTLGSERTHKDSLAALGAHCDITLGSVRVWLARAQVSLNTSMPERVTTQTRDAKSVRVKATLHRAQRRSDGSKWLRAGWKGSHRVSASSTCRQCSSHSVLHRSGRSSMRLHHPPTRTEFPQLRSCGTASKQCAIKSDGP